jgi:hypothetical protein
MTSKQYSDFMADVGPKAKKRLRNVIGNKKHGYHNMTKEQKVKLLKSLYNMEIKIGKAKLKGINKKQ